MCEDKLDDVMLGKAGGAISASSGTSRYAPTQKVAQQDGALGRSTPNMAPILVPPPSGKLRGKNTQNSRSTLKDGIFGGNNTIMPSKDKTTYGPSIGQGWWVAMEVSPSRSR
eukprot:gnl/TRDRNA2_/TRDRNA2_152913_c2_seq1.p1 gnl/TRDRNA2_/TRDRNA2_152913_c2~~gnl/TRDRNA2_/TRDRNA2_152913_c2_seq1.p1  ORF type:complete len:112 (+),score=10.16 gnl/TRDRNA2_/TRDRNA2_152913_c2_seq1:451-786(+)